MYVHLGMKFQSRRNPYYRLSANTIRQLNFLVFASVLFSREIYPSAQDQHKIHASFNTGYYSLWYITIKIARQAFEVSWP